MKFQLTDESTLNIHVFDNFTELAEQLIPDLTSGSVGLSGGSTYDTLFEEWAKMNVPLEGNWYCAVDERKVPVTDPESNWGNACRKLFTPLNVPEQCNNNYHTAKYCERLLENRFTNEPFVFNAIFLGVGDDGHTASLFPKSKAASDLKKNVYETKSPKGVEDRISLGIKVISNAEKIITVISGKNKKNCIKWLKNKELKKPFLSVLSNCGESELYLDRELYNLFLESDE